MLDPRASKAISEVIRRESRSLLAYVHDAFPWATAGKEPAVEALRQASTMVGEAVASLGRFLARHRVRPPMLPSYPSYFTYCNFLSVDWWLPRVLASERESLAQLEEILKSIPDAEAREAVQAVAEAKRSGMKLLEGLSGQPAAA
jgi:hypothetical protein